MSRGTLPQTTTPQTNDKNQKLGLMLYALGGALRGDKDFVQNTMALQQMQEGKKKEEERKRRYNEMIAKMDPESPLYQFSKIIGSEGVDKIAEAQFELATREPEEMTPAEQIKAQEADVLKTLKTVQEEIEAGTRTLEPDQTIIDFLDDYEKLILKNYIERAQQEDSLSAIINAFQAGSGQSPLQITKVE